MNDVKKPVLVPAEMPIAYHLTEASKKYSVAMHKALCADCMRLQVEAAGAACMSHYRVMHACEALDLHKVHAYGMFCESCGQVFTLSLDESEAMGWKRDMQRIDISMFADEILNITDGEGGRADDYYNEPLVSKARALALMVLGRE